MAKANGSEWVGLPENTSPVRFGRRHWRTEARRLMAVMGGEAELIAFCDAVLTNRSRAIADTSESEVLG
jgi:hypothetical protein